ncbi:C40 family peptidase [Pararhizobium mangrovi]|uniref:NlpC/P60 family protein n=1 Tax=Pararhizobium mangrovi TaxID=2590452 RepID=A0A506UH97_9HYPH|nr:NlpC/P60 family protein [Pararhizobium mangrovi]TPW32677.1 NlpC/P60 family protein [Pararhizobium mangrovi]
MSDALDQRLHAYRKDLADVRLKDTAEAATYVEAKPCHVVASVADLKRAPRREAGTDTQLLLGEAVEIFEHAAGWCWVQAKRDGYVGYVEEGTLRSGTFAPTHRIVAQRTFVYPDADLRLPPTDTVSAGSLIAIDGEAETRGTRYFRLAGGGAVVADHCRPVHEPAAADYVSIATRFLHTPYLWGGRSGFGIDCSGLVQLSLQLAGHEALRDTDMQEGSLGHAFDPAAEGGLRRGDLIFWKGHVGIMEDGESLLHANGHAMAVAREPLDAARARIAATYGPPTCFRRIAGAV